MEKIPVRHIGNVLKEPELSGKFSIRALDVFLHTQDMVQELHRHDFYYVLVLKKGTGTHLIDFTSYPIAANTVFIMRPGQVHQLELNTGSEGYLLQFGSDFYYPNEAITNRLLRKASIINHYKVGKDSFGKIMTALAFALQEFTDKQANYMDAIKSNLTIFFIELLRQEHNADSHKENNYVQEQLDALYTLLEKHALEHKQVSDYADMLNLSAYQLNAITKKLLGKTTSELINEYIILEAKRYLLATANQVSQVADHLGYEDASYFIRFFKKHTGFSPETFRQHFK